MRIRFLLLALAVTLGAQAKTALLQNVSLQWKPTSELKLGTMQTPSGSIQFETFQDERNRKEAIGENLEDDPPKPVTTTDDVGAFVGSHMRGLFDHAGLRTVDSEGSIRIKGEVRQFFVTETATYKSVLVVHLTVADKSGKTLWSGLASGDATRFGRSYKLENYYEVLSDAVVNSVTSLLESTEFQKALSGH
ncbi:MAG: hypothetical protein JOZ89_05685 [Gammaproteobacteria bacterium]|nr:hypothetical protein [Gammaproteobacteria bacterium]